MNAMGERRETEALDSSSLHWKLAVLAAVLLCQGALLYGLNLQEILPQAPAIEESTRQLGDWETMGEERLDAATEALLRPDLSVMRGYRKPDSRQFASVFVGYFKTSQANHPGPHSPKVCLPGAGWRENYSRDLTMADGQGGSFSLNEYALEKGPDKLMVLYWYQNSRRTWADAVLAKVFLLPDYFQARRSDVAFVRITSTARAEDQRALEGLRELARHSYLAIRSAFAATTQTSSQ